MSVSYSKYSNHARSICGVGHFHRSRLECAVCGLLQARQAAGEFKEFRAEVHTLICGPEGHDCESKQKIQSVVDFRCEREDGSHFFVEAKGMETPEWRLKLRLWRHYRTEPLEIWRGTHNRPYLAETVNG